MNINTIISDSAMLISVKLEWRHHVFHMSYYNKGIAVQAKLFHKVGEWKLASCSLHGWKNEIILLIYNIKKTQTKHFERKMNVFRATRQLYKISREEP